MRYFIECEDNEERIHKVPLHVREAIRAEALEEAVQRVEVLLDQGGCPDCSFTSRDQQIIAATKGDN